MLNGFLADHKAQHCIVSPDEFEKMDRESHNAFLLPASFPGWYLRVS
jgi:hypothetical protein